MQSQHPDVNCKAVSKHELLPVFPVTPDSLKHTTRAVTVNSPNLLLVALLAQRAERRGGTEGCAREKCSPTTPHFYWFPRCFQLKPTLPPVRVMTECWWGGGGHV